MGWLVYDRSPKVALVQAKDPKKIHIRSKYFETETTLGDFIQKGGDLNKINGIEKMFAVCAIGNERDHHPNNFMVNENMDLVKIDHGRSLSSRGYPKTFREFAINILTTDQGDKYYGPRVQQKQMKFNLHKYAENLNDMLSIIKFKGKAAVIYDFINKKDVVIYDLINDIVDKRIEELKKLGYKPNNNDDFEKMKSRLAIGLSKHVDNMINYAKTISEISERVVQLPDSREKDFFENYGWISSLPEALGESSKMTPKAMEKLIKNIHPKPWGDKTINDFFEVIKADNFGLNVGDIKKFLKDNPAFDAGKYKDKNGFPVLTKLIEDPRVFEYMEYLKDSLILIFRNSDDVEGINAQDPGGKTLLMKMVDHEDTQDSIQIIKFLIAKGANTNVQDANGNTALMRALNEIEPDDRIVFSELSIMLLARANCNLELINNQGKTVIDIVKEKISNSSINEKNKKFLEKVLQNLQKTSPDISIKEKEGAEVKILSEKSVKVDVRRVVPESEKSKEINPLSLKERLKKNSEEAFGSEKGIITKISEDKFDVEQQQKKFDSLTQSRHTHDATKVIDFNDERFKESCKKLGEWKKEDSVKIEEVVKNLEIAKKEVREVWSIFGAKENKRVVLLDAKYDEAKSRVEDAVRQVQNYYNILESLRKELSELEVASKPTDRGVLRNIIGHLDDVCTITGDASLKLKVKQLEVEARLGIPGIKTKQKVRDTCVLALIIVAKAAADLAVHAKALAHNTQGFNPEKPDEGYATKVGRKIKEKVIRKPKTI